MKRLKEEPRELGFLAKSFMGFCASRDVDEQKEKLDDLLHTVLCRAFLIQIGTADWHSTFEGLAWFSHLL